MSAHASRGKLRHLNQPRGRAIVARFLAASVVLAAFPQVDLFVSGLFYADGFPFDETWPQRSIRTVTTAVVSLSVLGAGAVYLFNRVLGRRFGGIDGKRVAYLVLVLALGAGLIVNLALKDNFGRARPRDVAEFGGTRTFTPAFSVSGECRKNCSFSSGEAAAGFFPIALAYALGRRRRAVFIAAIVFGSVVSVARIAAGAHFLSDTVVSFFIMWLLADALYFAMGLAPREATRQLMPVGASPSRVAATTRRAPVE
jgi:lipid A 4'-phosphatase